MKSKKTIKWKVDPRFKRQTKVLIDGLDAFTVVEIFFCLSSLSDICGAHRLSDFLQTIIYSKVQDEKERDLANVTVRSSVGVGLVQYIIGSIGAELSVVEWFASSYNQEELLKFLEDKYAE